MHFLLPIFAGSIVGVKLSGTSGSPNLSLNAVVHPSSATASWVFNTDGTLDKHSGDFGGTQTPQEWFNPNSVSPPVTYYLRATLDSGDAPDLGTLNSWLALSSQRVYSWQQSGEGNSDGTLQIEIASDAAGNNIVATGYYRGRAVVTL